MHSAVLWCGNKSTYNKEVMRYLTELKGNWNDIKEKLEQKFAMLTDNDLWFVEGEQDEMLGRIQLKLGKTNEEMNELIFEL